MLYLDSLFEKYTNVTSPISVMYDWTNYILIVNLSISNDKSGQIQNSYNSSMTNHKQILL